MINKFADNSVRQTELENCTFVKTALMLLVVVYHSVLYWGGNWFAMSPVFSAPAFSVVAQWLNTFHIYAFALVSGYLFYYLKFEQSRYDRFFPFINNKARRLLLPYVFISIAWVVPFHMYFFQYNAMDLITKYGLGTAPSQLWFLLMLFCVFAIFYPLSAFFKKDDVGGAVLALGFYGIGFLGQIFLPNIFQIFRACTYIPLFWLGFKIRQYGSDWLRKIPSVVWILADVFLFVLSYIVAKLDGVIFSMLYQGVSFLLHIVGAVMAFVVLQKLADCIKWKENKLFRILTKNSMTVYLLHQQVIYVFLALLNGKVNPYIHASINFVGAMVISLLLSTLLMKFKATRILMGEK